MHLLYLICLFAFVTLISWQQERDEHTVFVEEAAKKSEHLKRENDRLRNLSADLSQQVWCKCYLFSFNDLCYVVSPFRVFLIYCKWELSGQNPTWPDKLKENNYNNLVGTAWIDLLEFLVDTPLSWKLIWNPAFICCNAAIWDCLFMKGSLIVIFPPSIHQSASLSVCLCQEGQTDRQYQSDQQSLSPSVCPFISLSVFQSVNITSVTNIAT